MTPSGARREGRGWREERAGPAQAPPPPPDDFRLFPSPLAAGQRPRLPSRTHAHTGAAQKFSRELEIPTREGAGLTGGVIESSLFRVVTVEAAGWRVPASSPSGGLGHRGARCSGAGPGSRAFRRLGLTQGQAGRRASADPFPGSRVPLADRALPGSPCPRQE